ncbi:spore germination protein D [Salinibacillus kushneri]|uniref:Spore germination protein D n=1 Tax=Salinibacillus kushneri TaxID=237682 RepID=A0A1I0IX41_9BACI|nr:spore germination lipoprotein GerD [Salinibacillus kushneri]SEU01979.1 spore germination protein D [Salinibacillus kushneri]
MVKRWFLILPIFLFITACGGNTGQTQGDAEYETTKKMLVDIIKTDEGKKALQEVLSDEKMKQQLVMDSAMVKDAINSTLTSDKGKQFWSKLFEDPKFVKTYTEATKDSQEKLMKGLMKDSEYQKSMMDLLQNPEMTDTMLQTLKSQQFREHLEKTIQETLESPLFKAQMSEILLKAAEDMQKQQGGQNQGQTQGSGQGGGGEGSSGSGGGSGGGGTSGGS